MLLFMHSVGRRSRRKTRRCFTATPQIGKNYSYEVCDLDRMQGHTAVHIYILLVHTTYTSSTYTKEGGVHLVHSHYSYENKLFVGSPADRLKNLSQKPRPPR